MGFHIAPHFNSYDIDPSMPEFELVRDFRFRHLGSGRACGWCWNPYVDEETGERKYRPIPEDNIALLNNPRYKVMASIHSALPAWKNLLTSQVKKAVDDNGLHVAFLDITHNLFNLTNALVNDTTLMEGAWDLISMVQKINGGITVGGEGMNETLLCQHFAQGHSAFGPDERMIPVDNYIPVNHMLYGDLCHLLGYHPTQDKERRYAQDACDEKRGFVPTLLRDYIYDLEEKDSISKKILERATD
jgi:hypothetical protein